MLEQVLKGLRVVEKYTVRVADEGIHKILEKAAERIESKYDIPRDAQAAELCAATCIGSWASIIFYSIKFGVGSVYNDFNSLFNNVPQKDFLFLYFARDAITNATIITAADADLTSLDNKNQNQRDGTIAIDSDVFSYSSIGGVLRPYLLIGNLGTIYYGVASRNFEFVQYGAVSLPWIISLYIRDDKSGGLLDKIRNRVKDLFTIRLPVPKPLPIANNYAIENQKL